MGVLATHPLSQSQSEMSGRGQGRNARHWAGCLQQSDPPPTALGWSRGSARKMTGPRKVGQGSLSSKRLETNLSFKM